MHHPSTPTLVENPRITARSGRRSAQLGRRCRHRGTCTKPHLSSSTLTTSHRRHAAAPSRPSSRTRCSTPAASSACVTHSLTRHVALMARVGRAHNTRFNATAHAPACCLGCCCLGSTRQRTRWCVRCAILPSSPPAAQAAYVDGRIMAATRALEAAGDTPHPVAVASQVLLHRCCLAHAMHNQPTTLHAWSVNHAACTTSQPHRMRGLSTTATYSTHRTR